jgi:anti-sigma factor RsiW
MSNLFDHVRFARDHRWAPRQMSGYVDGELATSGRVRLERHLGECEPCRRLLAGLRQTLAGLDRLPAPVNPDPIRFAANVRVRLREPRRSD